MCVCGAGQQEWPKSNVFEVKAGDKKEKKLCEFFFLKALPDHLSAQFYTQTQRAYSVLATVEAVVKKNVCGTILKRKREGEKNHFSLFFKCRFNSRSFHLLNGSGG